MCVGRLRSIKGGTYAVGAIRQLTDWGVAATLSVVGGDPPAALAERSERAAIEAAVRQAQLTDRVALLGDLPRDDIRALLQTSDVLLHLSLSEGFSVAVLEAMACGLPVVASEYEGVREALEDRVHGLVVPLKDPAAAARALLALHRDPSLADRMGAAGRARVVGQFTLDRHLEAFRELYEQLLRMPSRVDEPTPRALACSGRTRRETDVPQPSVTPPG